MTWHAACTTRGVDVSRTDLAMKATMHNALRFAATVLLLSVPWCLAAPEKEVEEEPDKPAQNTSDSGAVRFVPPSAKLDIPFSATNQARAAIVEWFQQNLTQFPKDAQAFQVAADRVFGPGFADWSKRGRVSFGREYFESWGTPWRQCLELLPAIRECHGPQPYKEYIERVYAELTLSELVYLDTGGVALDLKEIPKGSKVVAITAGDRIVTVLSRELPSFDRLKPVEKERIMAWLTAFNPCFKATGYYIAKQGAVAESWDHVAIDFGNGETQVCLYKVFAGGPFLLPPDSSISGLIAKRPQCARDLSLPTVSGPIPRRVLRLRFDSRAAVPELCDLMEIAVPMDWTNGRPVDAYVLAPEVGNIPTPVHIVSGSFTDMYFKVELAVNLAIRGMGNGGDPANIATSISCAGTNRAGVLSGTFSGGWQTETQRKKWQGTLTGWIEEQVGSQPPPTDRSPCTNPVRYDYPAWRNNGDAAARDCGHPLVDSVWDARFCWRANAKTYGSYFSQFYGVHAGYQSPLVYSNKVIQYIFDPDGIPANKEAFEAVMTNKASVWLNGNKGLWGDDMSVLEEYIPKRFSVAADDAILAFNAQTGLLDWKVVYKGKGLNHSGNHPRGVGISAKTGPLATPCIAFGRLFVRGSAGGVFAMDALTGKPLWESTIGEKADYMDHFKRAALREKWKHFGTSYELVTCPAVVDRVLLCSDHIDYSGGQRAKPSGLIALDVDTGKTVWRAPGSAPWCGSPVPWPHQGKIYIISSGSEGLSCLDPKDGRILWTIKDMNPGMTPSIKGDDLIVHAGPNKTGLSCYRLSPTGARCLWSLPSNMNGGRNNVILGDMVFVSGSTAVLADMRTGRVIGTSPEQAPWISPLASDGYVLSEGGVWYKATTNELRLLTAKRPLGNATCVTPVLADGRLFVRGSEYLACYDLRKQRGSQPEEDRRAILLLNSDDTYIRGATLHRVSGAGRAPELIGGLVKDSLAKNDTRGVDRAMGLVRDCVPSTQLTVLSAVGKALAASNKSATALRVAIPFGEMAAKGSNSTDRVGAVNAIRPLLAKADDESRRKLVNIIAAFGADARDAAADLRDLPNLTSDRAVRQAVNDALLKIADEKPSKTEGDSLDL